MFSMAIDAIPGAVVERDGFVFADLLPASATGRPSISPPMPEMG
jgi:hypothetical protein